MPTTVWTLPVPVETGLTALRHGPDTHGPDVAAHDGLPQRIHRVLTAFGRPTDTLILTTSGGGDHPQAGPVCGGGSGDDAPEHGSVMRRAELSVEAASGHQLVVLDAGCCGLDDRSAATVAGDVAPGGTLAVLTHSHRHGGRLRDPSGSVIAALQDADLLYLQHIVIVEHILNPHPGPQQQTGGADDDADRPGRGLVDLTLFLRPGRPTQPRSEKGAAR